MLELQATFNIGASKGSHEIRNLYLDASIFCKGSSLLLVRSIPYQDCFEEIYMFLNILKELHNAPITLLCDSTQQFNQRFDVESKFKFVSIVSPTYNERENIVPLIERISKTMIDRRYEIIFVDDNSLDGTAQIAKDLSEKYPVRVVLRDKKSGLASAIITGFRYAQGEIVGVIDADLQHPPETIIQCVEAIEHDGYDIAIGSRYVKGGGVEGWSRSRLLASKVAILLARPLVGRIKDPVSGFFFLKKSVIENVVLNPTGYKLGLEILLKGNYGKVVEVPYVFRKRERGCSKLDDKEILLYLRLLQSLYFYKFSRG